MDGTIEDLENDGTALGCVVGNTEGAMIGTIEDGGTVGLDVFTGEYDGLMVGGQVDNNNGTIEDG